jgi:hypothetical protein
MAIYYSEVTDYLLIFRITENGIESQDRWCAPDEWILDDKVTVEKLVKNHYELIGYL